jgi:hypothetical protein
MISAICQIGLELQDRTEFYPNNPAVPAQDYARAAVDFLAKKNKE